MILAISNPDLFQRKILSFINSLWSVQRGMKSDGKTKKKRKTPTSINADAEEHEQLLEEELKKRPQKSTRHGTSAER